MGFSIPYIELIKIGTDIFLMLSIVYLGFRIFRSPAAERASSQVNDLNSSLRALIKDADLASRSLNDQLLKRQQSLERLLSEFEGAESRVHRAVEQSEESMRALSEQLAAARQTGDELSRAASKNRGRDDSRREETRREKNGREESRQDQNEEFVTQAVEEVRPPEPPSFESIVPKREPVRVQKTRTNIYGEEIAVTTQPLPMPATAVSAPIPAPIPEKVREGRATQRYLNSLSSKVERQFTKPASQSVAASQSEPSIEEVYDAAERLLRAGKDLTFVAAATNLPIEDVQTLSRLSGMTNQVNAPQVDAQVVESADANEPGSRDARLGVLGGAIKRQVQVI